ncbi:hypothetical protein BVY04_02030 [bacterium M21]|nr:hypothetical protein BVY04_02030 [bacterium M21]
MLRAISLLTLSTLGASLIAEESKHPIDHENRLSLEREIVVATRHGRSNTETPYTVHRFDADEVTLEKQAQTLPEALGELPGVMLQKTGNGMTSPYLRGFTSQRVALFADGLRRNNSYLREGPNQYWNQIDHYFYSDINLLTGPASVLYGSDAIGGVVYVRSPEQFRGESGQGAQWQIGRVVFRGSTAENSLSEHLQGSMALNDTYTLTMGLSRQDFGDLRTGDSTDNPNSGYEQWSANLRLSRWFNDDERLVFGYDKFDQDDVNRPHKTIDYIPWEGTTAGSDLARLYDYDHEAIFSRYELRDGTGLMEEVDFGLSYQNFIEKYHRDRNDGREQDRFTRVETLGLDIRLQSQVALGTLSWGIDYYHDNVNSSGYNTAADGTESATIQGSVADDARYDQTGTYLQLETPLSDCVELITGMRYSYVDMDAGVVDMGSPKGEALRGNWDAACGSGRVLFKAMDKNDLNIFAGISQGFRAPNLSDATRDGEYGSGTEAPTTDLREERFRTYEIGTKSMGDLGYFSSAYYYTDIEDRVGRLEDPQPTKRNLEEGYVQGVEFDGGINLLNSFLLSSYISWQEGEELNYADRDYTREQTDRPMSRMMPLTGQVALRWQEAGSSFWTKLSINWAREQHKLADADSGNRFPTDGTPAWETYNLSAGLALTLNLDIALALENITDENYRIHGSGINEPGRNLIATVIYKF